MSCHVPLRSTRSGKEFTPFQPVYYKTCVKFAALLQDSTESESERISTYEDVDVDIPAVSVLHDGAAHRKCPPCRSTDPLKRRDNPLENQDELIDPAKHARMDLVAPAMSSPTDAKKQSDSHKRRKYKRQKQALISGQLPRPETVEKYIKYAKPINTDYDFSTAPAAAGAYCAKPTGKIPDAAIKRDLPYFESMGFQLIKWDAMEDRPIVDADGVIVAVLVAPPKQKRYRDDVKSAMSVILEERKNATFSEEESNHPRGTFPAVNVGVTHGNGTMTPVNLNTEPHTPMVNQLLQHQGIRAMAGFASASFAAWAPRVYSYYKDKLDTLYGKMPHLRRNFVNSVFPAATFNFGPRVCTDKHRDVLNCPFGWCSIQALGEFDHGKGGHIVLWELKLVIEFPSGSLILIPSASVTHSNIPVSEDETRASFTQYGAGGLFRYVDYNMRTEKQMRKEDREHYEKMMSMQGEQWKTGLQLMARVDDREE